MPLRQNITTWRVVSGAEVHSGNFVHAGLPHSLAAASNQRLSNRFHLAYEAEAVETKRIARGIGHLCEALP